MNAMEFAVTIGFDAMRIATGRPPKHHDVKTICRWLQHASTNHPSQQPTGTRPTGSTSAPHPVGINKEY